MKRLLFFLASLGCVAHAQAQQILLLTEDFESPSALFAFDTGGVGVPAGDNRWIINTEYSGGGIYPNTISQDSTVTGTIGNAPYSTYLHIHDATAAPAVANANFNPASASDRFAYIDKGFCTLGLTDVTLAFFYLCEGSATAYGEVYYSIDGGPWIKTGAAQYSNQSRWKYTTISDPAFSNVSDLRFGFRWVNAAGSGPPSASFAIDDIIVVGTYDAQFGTNLHIDFVSPNPICRQSALIIQWSMDAPLCDGTYRIELSGANGSFANRTNLGVFNILNQQTSGAVAVIISGNVAPGSCYKVRLVRVSPQPFITGQASVCVQVNSCANVITTMTPIVTIDQDTVCALSAIDVPFTSTRVYNNNNVYVAQLSDSAGNFEYRDTLITADTLVTLDTIINPPDTIVVLDTTIIYDTIYNIIPAYSVLGTLPSSETFDPAIGAMPGTVSGLIPRVPEGCNYYIRVVSTSPVAVGSLYGPFCIKHCDITTNNTVDLHFCISGTSGASDTVDIDIHEWDTLASYLQGNRFIVQLLDMMFFTVVNEGGLGIVYDTSSTSFILTVPPLNDLLALGILPGVYYMRIIADSSTHPWNSNGTIIRLTIGAPADNLAVIPERTVYCNTEIAALYISPYNPESEYEWLSASLNNGIPLKWPFNPLLIDFSGAPPGPYTFRVRETNYGCTGNYSPLATIFITTIPNVAINGPSVVCQGDTFLYDVSFLPETYYQWGLSWGTIVDTSNNEVILTFDSVGTAQLSLEALNICGQRSSTFNIEVVEVLTVDAGTDTAVCDGASVELKARGAGFNKEFITDNFGFNREDGHMFNLKADVPLVIKGFSAFFDASAIADVAIYYRPASFIGAETDPTSWTLLGTATGIATAAGNNPTGIPINLNITMPAGSTYGFYITTTNGTQMKYTNGTSTLNIHASDGYLNYYEGTGITYPFSSPQTPRIWNGVVHYFTEYGVNYLWSTGDTVPAITVKPDADATYAIRVFDDNGCGQTDSVHIRVNPLPAITALPEDSLLCSGERMQLTASGAHVYRWTPATGLDNPEAPDPVFSGSSSTVFIVEGRDTLTGCMHYDTLKVSVESCELFIRIPQAFTPNGDGVNDFFTVFGDNIEFYEIRIFNRWGEQVYYSNNIQEVSQGATNLGWDGTHRGKPQDTGTYVYFIQAGKGSATLEKKGNLTLIR
ncbi:MAG: hypothetical protein KatS3mg031_2369 [Chitinophagales bacterium]|nr:MAG: hypothetical protein KatS3mg031_2369 [Chitinophagales bacterium]